MITKAEWQPEWTPPYRYLLRMTSTHPELSQFCTAFILAVEGDEKAFQYCTRTAAAVWAESQRPDAELAGEEKGATNGIIFLFNALWEKFYEEPAFEITYPDKPTEHAPVPA